VVVNSRNVLIFNGQFGSGKSTLISRMLSELLNATGGGEITVSDYCLGVKIVERESDGLKIARIAGGPILRDLIRNSHGEFGDLDADDHCHEWHKEGLHNHGNGQPHKPFIVLDSRIIGEDFRRIGELAIETADFCDLVVVESGTGRPIDEDVEVKYSTELLLDTWKKYGLMDVIDERLLFVVGIETDYELREGWNIQRKADGVDGIIESWKVPPLAMAKTALPDFKPLEVFGDRLLFYQNDGEMDGMGCFARESLLPRLMDSSVYLEGNTRRRGVERF